MQASSRTVLRSEMASFARNHVPGLDPQADEEALVAKTLEYFEARAGQCLLMLDDVDSPEEVAGLLRWAAA